MPGYGGILSGLVQGYGQAVIGNEKRQYEEKERKRQEEAANYSKVMTDAIAQGNTATAQWAQGKLNEVFHPSGKQQKDNPFLGILNGLIGHGGGQHQPQQGAPGGQQAPAAPQAPAQPVNPQGSAPTTGQPQPGMAASPGSTTPVVRPQLTPLPQKPGAVDPNISAAGQAGGPGQQRQLLPNLGEVMGQDSARARAAKLQDDLQKQQAKLQEAKEMIPIEAERAKAIQAATQAGDIAKAAALKRVDALIKSEEFESEVKQMEQFRGSPYTAAQKAAIADAKVGIGASQDNATEKVDVVGPDGKQQVGFRDPKSKKIFDDAGKEIDMSKGFKVAEKSTNSAEVKDLRRLEELKRKPNLTPEEKDEKTALEYRAKQLNDASRRADAKLTISLQSVTTPPGSREWANEIAQKIVDHEMAPGQIGEIAKGFGKRTQEVSQMISEGVNRIDPHFNYQEADANFKLSNSVGFQQTIRYMDSVQNSIPLVIQRAQELGNSNVRFVNGLANMGKAQLNDPKLAKFQTDALLVADEVAKILQGGGTGSGTSDAKLKQAAQIIRDSDSPKAIAAKLGEVQQLIRYRKDSLTKGTYIGSNSSQNNGGGFSPLPEKPAAAPTKGEKKNYQGHDYVFDGSVWKRQ